MPRTLEERLDTMREAFSAKATPEATAMMTRVKEELRPLAANALGVGATAPDFTLPDSRGADVSLAGVLGAGPAILTFFRGHW